MKLTLLFLTVLVTPAVLADVSQFCKDPAQYDGSIVVTPPGSTEATTCDASLGSSVQAYYPGVDTATFSCSDNANTTLGLAGIFLNSPCCGSSEFKCNPDVSLLCKEPAQYDGSTSVTLSGVTGSSTCDGALEQNLLSLGVDTATFSCSDNATTTTFLISYFSRVVLPCCGSSEFKCKTDMSLLCKDPAQYDGSTSITVPGATATLSSTCDVLGAGLLDRGIYTGTFSCSDSATTNAGLSGYMSTCCGSSEFKCDVAASPVAAGSPVASPVVASGSTGSSPVASPVASVPTAAEVERESGASMAIASALLLALPALPLLL